MAVHLKLDFQLLTRIFGALGCSPGAPNQKLVSLQRETSFFLYTTHH
jgi:hypothetical protein